MTPIDVRLGTPDDVDDAVSVYERSIGARRQGDWPSRSSRVAAVRASLHEAASWFLIGRDGDEAVAMAHVQPFRADGGAGQALEGALFVRLLYVLPDRWGEGIGGTLLDAAIAEAARRGCSRIFLWTHERDNERAHWLYQSRRFAPTGRTANDEAGKPIAEWPRDA